MSTTSDIPILRNIANRLGSLILLFAALFTLEWLFLATKMSFLTGSSIQEKIWVWGSTLLALLLITVMTIVLVGVSLENLFKKGTLIFGLLISLLSSFLLTLLILLVLDDFAYTLFEIGLKLSTLSQRRLISFLILLIFIIVFRRNLANQNNKCVFLFENKKSGIIIGFAALTTLILSSIAITNSLQPTIPLSSNVSQGVYRPNIIIIGIDAVESAHMSFYGYNLNTTPFLLGKKHEFLIAENSFTNSATSFGSIGSLLTGKYASTTRLLHAPEVLLGNNQFEHFPGLLQDRGYRSLDMSLRWYTDPKDMNLLNAFNESNFRTIYSCAGGLGFQYFCAKFPKQVLLVEQVFDRVMEKLTLINPLATESDSNKMLQDMSGPKYRPHLERLHLVRVGQPTHYYHEDDDRIDKAINFMRSSRNRPFFINLHMMATHGPYYVSRDTHFSEGLRQVDEWQAEFYDDSILRLDESIRKIFNYLDSADLLESTVVVITSDHGKDHTVHERLPLMIRFPNADNNGVIKANTGRIDVAPTLLNYMGWETPPWMEGRSLLTAVDITHDKRPLFSANSATIVKRSGSKSVQYQPGAPFFSLGGVDVIMCDQIFSWDLSANTWEIATIEGHTVPCSETTHHSPEEFQHLIIQHLNDRSYETTTLKNPVNK